jgi:mannose-6-phosphate isomerase-like protein (cupin superfamily)
MATSSKTAEVLVGKAGESPAYWYRDLLWNVLFSADQTLGEFGMLEQLIPPGGGPPTHVHERQAEGFYIISGEMDFVVGLDDEVVHAGPGSAIWVPKYTRHSFRIGPDEPVRLLNFYTPGGFEEHLPYYGVEATTQTLPPEGTPGARLDKERKQAPLEGRLAYLQRISDIVEGTWEIPTDDLTRGSVT